MKVTIEIESELSKDDMGWLSEGLKARLKDRKYEIAFTKDDTVVGIFQHDPDGIVKFR